MLARVSGVEPRYDFRGDEMYVRAQVVSTRAKVNPYREGEFEAAWVQPVGPAASTFRRAPTWFLCAFACCIRQYSASCRFTEPVIHGVLTLLSLLCYSGFR